MKTSRQKYWNVLWIMVLVLAIISCKKNSQNSMNTAEVSEAVLAVKTAPVVRKDMIDTVWIYGEVKLRWEAELASQFDGRLTEFNLLIGDRVKKNQKISVIVPPTREALLQIKEQMDPEVQPILERQAKSIALYSPINGIVLDMWHHNGDVIQKGNPIVHIGDLSILDVLGDLPIRYLPLVKDLKKVSVMFVDYPQSPVTLPLEAIAGKVNETSQTVPVRCGLNNGKGLYRPGMRVRIYFPGKKHLKSMVVPRQAVLEEEGIFSVFIPDKGIAKKQVVQVGIKTQDEMEILEGLDETDKVIITKTYSLTDGMKVAEQ